MKKLLCPLLLLVLVTAWGPLGCSNNNVDTAKLQSAFQGAPAEVETNLTKGIAAINTGHCAEALPALQRVAFAAKKMTPDQREILEDAIKKVKAKAK